ncbi:hypothetical protein V8B55DRAFT_1176773 [Mucor lusitanicus]|uniref:Uncharacterized protein n=1 Tax=Mucor circinelloides f. lusitanicus TaxID=29924 RepID=A0A8H4BAE8_MUCCL|nr:hypothetical protein FB192DRAFT_1171485 [Mucor lusitanicus]
MNITFMEMTFKHGSMALLTFSKRFKMPESLNELPHLLPPVLRAMYICAVVTKESADMIKRITSVALSNDESVEDFYYFPMLTASPSHRRKKLTTASQNNQVQSRR